MRVADYIADLFVKELNISTVFMVTGGGAMFLNDGFGKHEEVNCIFNHHEQASAIGAEGYYRTCGKPAAVNITTGPGGLNTLTGLMGQWTDSIPAFYISGQVKSSTTIQSQDEADLRQLGDQEVDIVSVVKPLTKYAVTINDPKDIQKEIIKAFNIMMEGRKGPVWINIPIDVQSSDIEPDSLELFSIQSKNPSVNENELNQCLKKIESAERPLVVAGHGIQLADMRNDFIKLIRSTEIPVVTTFNGYDSISEDDSNYVGRIGTLGTRAGNYALQNSDCILFLGTRNNIRQVSYNWSSFAKNGYKIVVDIDPEEHKKNTMIPDLAIKADLKVFIDQIMGKLSYNNKKWLGWCKKLKNQYPVVLPEMYKCENLSPYYFMEKISDLFKDDEVVVAGNGTACVALFQAGKVKNNQRVFWNSGCASMGYALPASIGASYSLDNKKRIICITGDGSLQMNLQELATIGFNNLPITIFVLNNNGYSSIRQTQGNFFGTPLVGCDTNSGIGFPRLDKLAEAYGFNYELVTKKNIECFNLDTLIDNPRIIEVIIDPEARFQPKLSSKRLADGSIVSSELEDMFPFLDKEEHLSNMIVK